MPTIKCNAVLTNLPVGEKTYYRLIPQNLKKVPEDEFLRRMAEKTGQSEAMSRFWMDAFRDELYAALASNEAVDLGFLYAKLYIGGSLQSANEQPTRDKNPIEAKCFTKGALADKIGMIAVVNDTKSAGAILYEVWQDGAETNNLVQAAGVRIVLNGNCIKLTADDDNGVWLENLTTGVKVAEADVGYSDSSVIHCSFATLPESGQYRLVVATRNAQDPGEYPVEKLSRRVTVVNNG